MTPRVAGEGGGSDAVRQVWVGGSRVRASPPAGRRTRRVGGRRAAPMMSNEARFSIEETYFSCLPREPYPASPVPGRHRALTPAAGFRCADDCIPRFP